MAPHVSLEAQIDRWRTYVKRHQAVSAGDADELEDQLREQIAALQSAGFDDEEAFLVAIKRLGNLHAVAREFAREHSDRLWRQLVLVPDHDDDDAGRGRWTELAVVLALGAGAGAAVRMGLAWITPSLIPLLLGPLIFPFLAAYFAWKRRLGMRTTVSLAVPFAALTAVLIAFPFAHGGSTELLAAIHAPVVLWALAGIAYTGGAWRSPGRRMDFVRFTGELAIYYTLLALGGAVLIGMTFAGLAAAGVDFEPALGTWVLPFAMPGALIVAAWLVEAKQNVIENIAPVLTRIFTPLTIVMLLVLLGALTTAGGLAVVDRDLLILLDAILVLVLCLLLYALSARDTGGRAAARPGFFDVLQVILVLAALAVDAVMLSAMLSRIAEFGVSPNKVAALGLNILLLVHLVRSAWLMAGFLRGRRTLAVLERWQTRYLPLYAAWAAAVVVLFPPAFTFA